MSKQNAIDFLQTIPLDPEFPGALLGFKDLGDLVNFAKERNFDFSLGDFNDLIDEFAGGGNANEEKFTAKKVAGAAGAGAAATSGAVGGAVGGVVSGVIEANNS